MSARSVIGLLLLTLAISYPIFNYLDALPIQQWDEARYANNAFEMYKGHNWLVNMYEGRPDMNYLKPPLMIWLQVISIRIFGVNELAIRFPSALAALGTCLLIFLVILKKLKDPWLASISVLVLVTINGYVTGHVTRTGDLDSLLTMLITGMVIFYFFYLEEGRSKYLYLTCVFLTLAMLTKGIQPLLMLPGLFIYTIYKKRLLSVIRDKHAYGGLAGIILVIASFYILREHYTPGYLRAVWESEIATRFSTALDDHREPALYYVSYIIREGMPVWCWFIIPGALIGLFSKDKLKKELMVCILLTTIAGIIVISFAQTKVFWYAAPVYPLLAIVAGVAIRSLLGLLADLSVRLNFFGQGIIPYLFLFGLFLVPYSQIIRKGTTGDHNPFMDPRIRNMKAYMKDLLHERRSIDTCVMLDLSMEEDISWYYNVLRYKGCPITRVMTRDLRPHDKVVAYAPDAKEYVIDHYNAQVLSVDYNDVVTYRLNGFLSPRTDTSRPLPAVVK